MGWEWESEGSGGGGGGGGAGGGEAGWLLMARYSEISIDKHFSSLQEIPNCESGIICHCVRKYLLGVFIKSVDFVLANWQPTALFQHLGSLILSHKRRTASSG